MIIYVISDTHRVTHMYPELLKRCQDAHLFCHLGDYCADAALLTALTGVPVIGVKGNGDFTGRVPLSRLEKWQGVPVYLTHGHREGVKEGLLGLSLAVRENGCRIGLFGHTHCPAEEGGMGVTLLNPGSLAGLRNPAGRTYLRLVCENGQFSHSLLRL